jgi:hypothetical protein
LLANGQTLLDSFADGNFTASPVWSGDTANWTIVANSDAAAGATASQTLRLNGPAISQTEHLRTQIAVWGVSQEWGVWIGRRGQAFTAANQSYVWLYANEADLESGTVDGYRLAIGDDTGGDDIRLERILNGSVAATVITSSGAIANALTDIGFLVRVTRSSAGVWTLFTSTLPTANGTGAIATDVPSSANASVNQGSATDATLTPSANGYFGVAALHSTSASAIIAAEFDQIYFTATCPTITIAPSTLSDGTVGAVYNSQTLTASGGTGPYTFAVTSGTLPTGLTLSSGVISGTPSAVASSTFTVTATDAIGCTGTRSYTVNTYGGYDQFNYSTGDINNDNGGAGWGSVWYNCGGNSAGMILSPGMSYTANNLAGSVAGNYIHSDAATVAYRRLSQYYGNSCNLGGSSIWISFIGRATFCNFNGFFGLSLFDSPGGDGCSASEKMFIGKRGGQNCNWGMQRNGGAGGDSSTAFDGTTRLIVVRIDFPGSGNNSARMWIDPAMTGTPADASAAVTLTGLADMCWDRVRVTSSAASFGNDAAGDIDELRFGLSFCDVISLQSPSVSISASPGSTVCSGVSVTFTATPSNAGNSPTYQWKKNGTTVGANSSTYTDASLATSDSITCTVTSAGCASAQATSSAITMTVNPIPNSTITAPSSVCPSSTGNTASVLTTGGASYNWTISGGTITAGQTAAAVSFTASASGSVVLNCTVTASGCSSGGSQNTTVAISAPNSTITAPSAVCPNSTGNAASVPTTAGATYAWTITGGSIPGSSTGSSILFTAGASGTVILNCTVTASGCSSGGTQNTTVTINPSPTISLGASPSVCPGSTSASLPYSGTTGSPDQYAITFDSAAITAGFANVPLTALPASQITVTVPPAAASATYNGTLAVKNTTTGCTGTGVAFTITILARPAVVLGASPSACVGTVANLTYSVAVGTPDQYSLSFDSAAQAQGFANVSFTSLPASPITIAVPANAAAGTYFCTNVVKDTSTGCVSTNSTFTVTVNSFRLILATALSENMGTTASGNPSVTTFTGWQNTSPITFGSTTSLTPDVRTTTASSGYSGASGSDNVFFSATTGARNFVISGINTVGMSSIQLQFGLKADAIVGGDPFVVEVSSDGTTYTPLTITQPSSTTAWALITASGSIPATSNLRLRFSKLTTSSWRLDDVKVQSVANSAAITANGPTTFCAGGSVTLTASAGGASYLWSTSETTPSIIVSASGTYTVTITDANGCTSQASQVVTVDPTSVGGTVASAAVCSGTGTTLTLVGSVGAVTKWQYSSDNFGSDIHDVANTTTSLNTGNLTATTFYRVIVTSGVCSSATSSVATVTVNSATANGVTYNETKGLTFKLDESDVLTHASGSGGVTLSSVSSPSANGVTIFRSGGRIFYNGNLTSNDSFTYTVSSVTGGCTATGTININMVFAYATILNLTPATNNVTLNLAGIPGFAYTVERSTNTTTWGGIFSTNAPAAGLFQFVDDFGDIGHTVPDAAYYRLKAD